MKRWISRFCRVVLLIGALSAILVPVPAIQAQEPTGEGPGPAQAPGPSAPQLPGAPGAVSKAFSGGPKYDSGWVSLAVNESKTLVHNLGGDVNQFIVDMQYRGGSADGVNLRYYGGADFGTSPAPGHSTDDRVGAYWRSLTSTSIIVYRRPEDTYAEQVRIRIWIDNLAVPEVFDSGWQTIAPDETRTINHPMGGSADDYVVDMQFKSIASGINQRYYGGSDFGGRVDIGMANDRVGAYWRTLTATSITIYRRPEDTYAEQIRVRIWKRPRATFDSGWVPILNDQAHSFAHNIGGKTDDYQVIMDFKAPDANGINQRAYGGMDVGTHLSAGLAENDRVGAYWRSLTSQSITVYRRPEDVYAPQIRIRIFNYWSPPAPNYDSGWLSITAPGMVTLNHNLGAASNNYMVDLLYRGDAANGINQRYYGGGDFGTSPAPGHAANDRVGAYWSNLTTNSISVTRLAEDDYALQVRIRIWIAPKPDYTSNWLALAQGASLSRNHDLGGNYQDDYLVVFDQYNSADGVNQRYYGGSDFGTRPPIGGAANERVGAYWHQLDNDSVTLSRRPEDHYASQVRIRIWRVRMPDYKSIWEPLTADTAKILAHHLNNNPNYFLVQMFQWDTSTTNALNHTFYGGADFGTLPPVDSDPDDRVGSYWRSLTSQEIVVYRRPEDGYADYVMIRIWDYSRKVYIPSVMK